MNLKYPSIEYRDLSEPANQVFSDPGRYSEKIFICETGAANRLLTPKGRFDNGFTVVIYNKGPNDITFDAAVPSPLIGPVIAPTKSGIFIYSSYDKVWYGPNYHSNLHESGRLDELDGDNLDIDWEPANYIPDDSIDEARNVDCLAAHLKGIDHEIDNHADHHISEGSDEIDGDRLDVDWNPSIYSPSISPSEVDSEDELTAHLKGIDDKIGSHSSRHTAGGDDELDGDNLDIDWNPSIYSPDDGALQADGLNSLTAHLLGIDNKLGTHVSRHERGGADELNGDHLDIDWNPTNYSPDSSISEAGSVDDLSAHLKGIDDRVAPSTTTHRGTVEIATPTEAVSQVVNTLAVSPAGLKSVEEVAAASSITLVTISSHVVIFFTETGTVDNIIGGIKGMELSLLANNFAVTINHASSGDGAFQLDGSTNLAMENLDVIKFYHDGTDWVELYRNLKT